MISSGRSWWLCLALSLGLSWVVGCGKSGPQIVPVSGTVTLDGNPIDKAGVMFIPDTGRPATGVTDPQGHFTLTTAPDGNGAEVGKYQVTVSLKKISGVAADANGLEAGPATGPIKEEYIVPQKYSDPKTSGITVEVKSGMEQVKLELTSK